MEKMDKSRNKYRYSNTFQIIREIKCNLHEYMCFVHFIHFSPLNCKRFQDVCLWFAE